LAAMITALVANGAIEEDGAIAPLIRKCGRIVAVDGGLHHCIRMGIRPHFFIGDGDSYDPEGIEVPHKLFPKEKDESDLKLALQEEMERGAERAVIFGALGRRLDHTLANLFLLALYPERASIETERERIFILPKEARLEMEPGRVLSLLPLGGPVKGALSRGLKWELDGRELDGRFFSLSNEAAAPSVSISYKEGLLLCSLLKRNRL